MSLMTIILTSRCGGEWSLKDYLSLRTSFPGLFAAHKDIEGYLRLTEKMLCEQRRNLYSASHTG